VTFRQFSEAFVGRLEAYIGGGSPRTALGDGLYTSTEYPAQQHISLHLETTYMPNSPHWLLFYCDVPPEQGGQTPVGDMAAVLRALPADLVERYEAKGVSYASIMHGGKGLSKSWQQTFETTDRAEVERILREAGYQFAWREDGSLRTTMTQPGVKAHPESGVKVWWNQAVNWHVSEFDERQRKMLQRMYGDDGGPKNALMGDGTPITDEEADLIRKVLREHEQVFEWRAGDVLICDNFRVAHARQAYQGKRRIMVSMGQGR